MMMPHPCPSSSRLLKPFFKSHTLDSGINVGVRLLIFEKFWRKKNWKMIAMPRLIEKSTKIMMWNFFRGGATVISGAMFIPESRVGGALWVVWKQFHCLFFIKLTRPKFRSEITWPPSCVYLTSFLVNAICMQITN